MSDQEPFVTYLELRESTAEGEMGAGLSHTAAGLVLLHVLELAAYGEPRGAVTVLHDAGEHGGRSLELARALANCGWAVALPDLRGHGQSEGARGHSAGIKEVLRDIGDIQDHLAYRQPDAPKVLIGQGIGALYALAYACEEPQAIAALILSAPLFEPHFSPPRASGGLLKMFKKPGPASPGSIGYQSSQLSSDAEQNELRSKDPLVHDVITLRAAEQASETAKRYRTELARLALPILILQGGEDPIAKSATTRAIAGDQIEIAVFDGLRHDLFHETQRAAVIERVIGWLESKFAR